MNTWINKITSLFTGLVMVVSLTANVGASADSSTEISVSYRKYIVSTNSVSDYTLTIDERYSSQARSITLPDERVRDGHTGIVSLSNGGTGFIVGDHVIATAAHCVNVEDAEDESYLEAYEHSHYFIDNITIDLYYENGTKKQTLTPVEYHIPNQFRTDSDAQYDYALITVSENLSNYTHFAFGVPYNLNSTSISELDVFVTGIPSTIPGGGGNPNGYVYTGKGNLLTSNNAEVIRYNCDTVAGNSGSPVYLAYQYYNNNQLQTVYAAIGIHHGGTLGSAMTPHKIKFYKSNTNISY